MGLSTEMNNRFAAGPRLGTGERATHRPRVEYALVETDITDLAQAASRIEAFFIASPVSGIHQQVERVADELEHVAHAAGEQAAFVR